MDTSFLNIASMPRGFRNNNPGNLVQTGNAWVGKLTVSSDARFEQFKSIAFGIRAMMVDIRNKIDRGTNTIEKLVQIWAPPHENQTQAYITALSRWSGIGAKQRLNSNPATLKALAMGISQIENGRALESGYFDMALSIINSSDARNYLNSGATPPPRQGAGVSHSQGHGVLAMLGILALIKLIG